MTVPILRWVSVAVVAALLTTLATGAQAQSSAHSDYKSSRGAEALVSFTVPFGDAPDSAKTLPRLDFAVRNYAAVSKYNSDWMSTDRQAFTETRLGLTLEDNPQLMLDGQVLILSQTDDQAGVNTAGKVGLGIAAVALVSVAVVAVIYATCDATTCDEES